MGPCVPLPTIGGGGGALTVQYLPSGGGIHDFFPKGIKQSHRKDLPVPVLTVPQGTQGQQLPVEALPMWFSNFCGCLDYLEGLLE